jgi:hypothetical protein
MMYKGVLQSSFSERKMREIMHNIDKQLKKHKVATKANQTRIVELEQNIISLRIDPKDPSVVGELVK